MYSTDEVKQNLLKFFSNDLKKPTRQFIALFGRLQNGRNVSFTDIEYDSKKDKSYKLNLLPFLIKGHDLALHISIIKDGDSKLSMRSIFTSVSECDRSLVLLEPKTYEEFVFVKISFFKNGLFGHEQIKKYYVIHPDYKIEEVTSEALLGYTLDIVTLEEKTYGSLATNCQSFDEFAKLFAENEDLNFLSPIIVNDYFEAIENEYKNNKLFKEAFDKYHMEEYIDCVRIDAIVLLHFIKEIPNRDKVLEFTNIIKSTVFYAVKCREIYNDWASPGRYFQEGDTLSEMLGFGITHPTFILFMNDYSYDYIIKIREYINRIKKVMPITDWTDIIRFTRLIQQCGFQFRPEIYALGKRGFQIKELFDYLWSMRESFHIEIYDTLDSLYLVNFLHEVKTGENEKFLPEYSDIEVLKKEYKRDTSSLCKGNSLNMLRWVIQKTIPLAYTDKNYSIFPITEGCENSDNVLKDAMNGQYLFFYRKSNGNKTIKIRVFRDKVKSVSDNLDPLATRHVMEWADKNKLLYDEVIPVEKVDTWGYRYVI